MTMRRYRLKQWVKDAMILLMYYLVIIGGISIISYNNKRLNKIFEGQKKIDASSTYINQK